jgi:hypothetical protein
MVVGISNQAGTRVYNAARIRVCRQLRAASEGPGCVPTRVTGIGQDLEPIERMPPDE